MEKLGRLTVRTNDRCDVITLDVFAGGEELSDESLIEVDDPQFDSAYTWVTGWVPQFTAVDIEGDTMMLKALFRSDIYLDRHVLRVYVEYEEVEEFVTNETALSTETRDNCLEPEEIIL